jgi:hypothetical protein
MTTRESSTLLDKDISTRIWSDGKSAFGWGNHNAIPHSVESLGAKDCDALSIIEFSNYIKVIAMP